jgi:hypothetical protein
MMKRNLIITALLILFQFTVTAQVKKQETGLKREVTLYNPYKPTLPETKKRSFLPDMKDTLKVKPDFRYDIITKPFMPVYTISPIKAASLLPDPLEKLYKSFVKIGLGNYFTPLAEISITNERSKKGTFGFYGRHFSTNGKVELDNNDKVFAGYMDNDASLFGRKFFRKSLFESSIDFNQKTRYAYGYAPVNADYSPNKEDIRLGYLNFGGKVSLASMTLDSTDFFYDFDLYYNYFYNAEDLFQHNIGIKGIMAKSYKGFYIGSGMNIDYYKSADSISIDPDYIISASPFMKKSTEEWTFKLGLEILVDRTWDLHVYPDIAFGFNIVPSYVIFFSSLSGKLERNTPLKVISENPFLVSNQFPDFVPNGSLFRLPDTDHKAIITGGLKGNTGINGNYLVSASYSAISDMLFYSNFVTPSTVVPVAMGNYFLPIRDEVKLFNIHAEMSEAVNDKITISGIANYYSYSTGIEYAWNKPDWDGKLGLKYNLRDKIIAGIEITAIGKRKLVVNGDLLSGQAGYPKEIVDMSSHFNLSLNAEYRYSKILSFWTKFENITTNRYYEWAYYPSQRFLMMVGFTYSL